MAFDFDVDHRSGILHDSPHESSHEKHMEGSINGGIPKWLVYNGKIRTKMGDLGIPPFQETSMSG